jgi:hypothetical protein
MRSGKSGRPSRPKSLLYDTWFQFRARWHDAAGLLEGCSGKERSIAWAGRFRQQAAARAARLAPGGPAVVPPTSYARGEVVRAGAKLAKQRAAPRTGVEREEEVAAAIERITRMPTERVAALQEMPCGSGASMPPGLLAFACPHSTSEFRAGDLQPILADDAGHPSPQAPALCCVRFPSTTFQGTSNEWLTGSAVFLRRRPSPLAVPKIEALFALYGHAEDRRSAVSQIAAIPLARRDSEIC